MCAVCGMDKEILHSTYIVKTCFLLAVNQACYVSYQAVVRLSSVMCIGFFLTV